MTGAFAEFERSMIRQRVWVGLSVRLRSSETANFVSKPGKDLAGQKPRPISSIGHAKSLVTGTGIIKTAKLTGLGTGTVHKLRRERGPARRVFPRPGQFPRRKTPTHVPGR
jgi:hypothetical protein